MFSCVKELPAPKFSVAAATFSCLAGKKICTFVGSSDIYYKESEMFRAMQ